MVDYGETATGFRRKTFSEIQGSIRTKLRRRIDPRLTLDELDWVGNAVDTFSDELDEAWKALEVARNGFDPDNAEGVLMIALAAVTGTQQKKPTKGTVPVLLGLGATKTFEAGAMIAHVTGDPTNRWVNLEEVQSTAAGDYPATFIAEEAGRKVALAGTLTVIAQTKSGWLTITNPTDADPGTDLEEVDDLRVRREEDLEGQASGGAAGIRADLLDVPGVLSAIVRYNDTETDTAELPKHSVRAIIWDGVGQDADDDAIAQALLDSKGATATAVGTSSGTAVDANGDDVDVPFDRASQVQLYIDGELEVVQGADTGVLDAAAKLAIIAGLPNLIGARAVFEKLKCQSLSVPGVTDVLNFKLGLAPSPTGDANILAAADQILVVDSSNINLTFTEQA